MLRCVYLSTQTTCSASCKGREEEPSRLCLALTVLTVMGREGIRIFFRGLSHEVFRRLLLPPPLFFLYVWSSGTGVTRREATKMVSMLFIVLAVTPLREASRQTSQGEHISDLPSEAIHRGGGRRGETGRGVVYDSRTKTKKKNGAPPCSLSSLSVTCYASIATSTTPLHHLSFFFFFFRPFVPELPRQLSMQS